MSKYFIILTKSPNSMRIRWIDSTYFKEETVKRTLKNRHCLENRIYDINNVETLYNEDEVLRYIKILDLMGEDNITEIHLRANELKLEKGHLNKFFNDTKKVIPWLITKQIECYKVTQSYK